MPLYVLLAVLLAALLHASWNFLVKRTADKHLSMGAVVLGHTPFALAALTWAPTPNIDALPWMLAGALLHTGYQIFLLHSYRLGDLSQIYPLARGAAPLIVAAASVLFLGVSLSFAELAAIVLIGTGIMSLTLVRHSDRQANGRAAVLALVTGLFIAAYSLVDGFGARLSGSALGFYGGLSLINALLFVLFLRKARPGLVQRIAVSHRLIALLGGLASFSAYALVIWAFTLAPIALVTAVRETSIIFAVLFGSFFLKEQLNPGKVLATMTTLIGVCLLRLSR